MTRQHPITRRPARTARLAPLALLALAAACNLDVSTPQVVLPAATQGEAALPTLLAGSVGDFAVAYAGYNNGNSGEGIVLNSGLFADEFVATDYFSTHRELDTRSVQVTNSSNGTVLLHLMQALRSSQNAAASYASAGQTNASGRARALNQVGLLYTIIAETYCSGVPFSSIDASGAIVYGSPKNTSDMLTAAIAAFNDALAVATAAGSSTQRYTAMVGKARALLDNGQFAAAATAVAGVPTSFVAATEHGTVDDRTKNGIYTLTFVSTRYTTADAEGVHGQPFVSAADPRVETSHEGTSSFDFSTELYAPVKYSAYTAPVPFATGVEARLIEAEAQYRAGSYATALQTLDDLRATQGIGPLVPATTPTTQEDQIFAERAFWLFGTAHRLGDLRRLVKQYRRGAETVFPTGAYFKGGAYGTQVTLRVPQEEEQDNPNYSRAACDPTKA
jgi:hypothetical protein